MLMLCVSSFLAVAVVMVGLYKGPELMRKAQEKLPCCTTPPNASNSSSSAAPSPPSSSSCKAEAIEMGQVTGNPALA